MENLLNSFLVTTNPFLLIIDVLMILPMTFIAYRIVRRIYERDFTFREIFNIHNGLLFSDMMSIRPKKPKQSLAEQFDFISNITEKTKTKFLLLDEERTSIILSFMIMKYIVPILVLLISVFQGPEMIMKSFIVNGFIIFSPEVYIKYKQNEHSKSFENYSYKIFKFINNQRSAGVPTQKIITKLHLVVNDEKLEKRLVSFAAEYISNNDYDKAFSQHIMKYYSSADARAVDNALRQGLNVGDLFAISDESEELMFEKYISYIDYETERRKIKSVLNAALFAITLLGIVGYPLIVDVSKAMEVIFSNQ